MVQLVALRCEHVLDTGEGAGGLNNEVKMQYSLLRPPPSLRGSRSQKGECNSSEYGNYHYNMHINCYNYTPSPLGSDLST